MICFKMRVLFYLLILIFFSISLLAQEKDKDFELLTAAYENNLTLVQSLLNDSANVDSKTEDGVTPLMYAAQNGNDTMVQLLISYGASVNEKPSDGFTALISACLFNHLETAITLIENHADINASNMYGATPLMLAAAYGYYIITDMLLFYGADTEIPDDFGNTALHIAAVHGFDNIVDLLINKGAKINTTDNNGNTPLMTAVINNNHPVIDKLMLKSCDINIQNDKGYTALMIALRNRNDSLIGILSKTPYNRNLKNIWGQNTNTVALINKNKCFYKCNAERNLKYYLPFISKISLKAGLNVTVKDIMYVNSIGFYDIKYGFHLDLGYTSRIGRKKILFADETNNYYQFNEKRSCVFAGIFKDFQLGYNLYKEYGINTGIKAVYTYGNIEGTIIDVENRYLLSPSIGLYFTSGIFTTILAYEYINYKTLHLSPHKLTIGGQFNINSRKNSKFKTKTIYWANL